MANLKGGTTIGGYEAIHTGNIESNGIFTNSGGTIYGSLGVVDTVYINSTADVSASSTNNPFQIGATAGVNLVMDGNEILARSNGSISTLYLNDGGGVVEVGGALTVKGNINTTGGLSQDGFAILNGTDTWLRTNGDTGWYSQTWGGGWYMTDSTWIRAYGGKGVYTAGQINCSGGYVGLGRVAPYTWTGTINTGTGVTITHNLGYYPIVNVNGGTVGNIIITTRHESTNAIYVYVYSSGGGNWASGRIDFY